MAKINSKVIWAHLSYTIFELTDQLHINNKTIRRWIDDGLTIVPGSKNPILIMGLDLKNYLKAKRLRKRIKINRNQFCCFRCRAARYAKRGSITIVGNQKKALCRVCNAKMCRTIKPSQKDYGILSSPS